MTYKKACQTVGVPKTTILDRVNDNVVDRRQGINAGRKNAEPLLLKKR